MFDKQKVEQIVRLAKRREMYAKAIEGIDVESAVKEFNERKKEQENLEPVSEDITTGKQNTK